MVLMRIRLQIGIPAGPPYLSEDELLFDPSTRQLLYVKNESMQYVIPLRSESLKTFRALIEIDHEMEQATYLLGVPEEDDFGVTVAYHSQGFRLSFDPPYLGGVVQLGIDAESAPYLDEGEPVSAEVTWEEETGGTIRFDVLHGGEAVSGTVYVRMGFEDAER